MRKKLALLLLTAAIAGLLPVSAAAEGELTLHAPSAVLMTVSGEILTEKDKHTRREPASVTKVMTLLLACEAVDDGRLSLNDTVTASAHAASMGGSQIWLKEGETLTVSDMLKCIAVVSANDCAVAMAEHLAGSEEAFVQQMNGKAQALGMEDTHFVNACGLPAGGHETSAYDIALMSAELLGRHPWIKTYTSIRRDSIRDGAFTLDSTNKLLRSQEGVTGLKTGYTSTAGYCISASAERDGLELIAVVLGCRTKEERTQDVTALLNYGFANYAAVTPMPDRPILPVPVRLGTEERVAVRPELSGPMILPKTELSALKKTIELPETAEAPVREGQQLGTLCVTSPGGRMMRIPLCAVRSVPRLTLPGIFGRLFSSICCREESA